ncbi:MAG: hypothetical protein WCI73_05515 [Phycisphaerae bacterium]
MTMSAKSPAVSPETGPSKCREAFTRPRRRQLDNASGAKIEMARHEIDSTKLDTRLVDTAAPAAAVRPNSLFWIVTQAGQIVVARVLDEAPDLLRRDRSSPLFHTATENAQVHARHYR